MPLLDQILSTSTRRDDVQSSNSYGNANISGRAKVVLGNIHKHYHVGTSLARQGTPFTAVALNEALDAQSRDTQAKDLPDLVSSYDASRVLRYLHARPAPGTCQWFQRTSQYRAWLSGRGPPILICAGSVGSGKSVSASALVTEFSSSGPDKKQCVVSYFVDNLRNEPTTTDEILRAFTKQLLLYHRSFRAELPQALTTDIREKLIGPGKQATPEIAADLFMTVLEQLPPLYIIVDGIDALAETEILLCIKFLRILYAAHHTKPASHKTLLFCRDTLGRGIGLDRVPDSKVVRITLEHVKHDIETFIDHEITERQADRLITNDINLIDKIKRVLKANSEKMFLWSRLQIATLWDPSHVTCNEDIEEQLESLPQGLEEIYIQCLQRIENTNDGRSRNIAPKVFKWVASAKQPLSELQVREAVSMTPDSLPLLTKNLLNTQVTDFCANLVEIGLDRTVRFPHPTVKEFLQDKQKLSIKFSRYHLRPKEDDLWCGVLCVAYATHHHARNSLVVHQTQAIDSNLASAIVSGTLPKSLSFRWTGMGNQKRSPTTFAMPVPSRRADRGLMGKDLNMHTYFCQHWLSHNRFLEDKDSAYTAFEELCLAHDQDLQPWVQSRYSSGVSRYHRLAEYAVMHNNCAIMRVAISGWVRQRHTPFSRTATTLHGLLRAPCPGTRSSFLHIAAALGHVDIARFLLSIDTDLEYLANDEGKSPAALAAELGQNAVFVALENKGLCWPHRHLRALEGTDSFDENLLNVCASHGNVEMLEHVFRQAKSTNGFASVSRQMLAEALFHAGQNGHIEAALFLVEAGADAGILNVPAGAASVHRTEWRNLEQEGSLEVALRENSSRLMRTLLAVGARPKDQNFHLSDIVDHCGHDSHRAKPFLIELCQHINSSSEDLVRQAFAVFQDLIYSSHVPHHMGAVQDYQRTMLNQCPPGNGRRAIAGLAPIQSRELLFNRWFNLVEDDILVRSIQLSWIHQIWLWSPSCLNLARNRSSTAFLNQVLRSLSLRGVTKDTWNGGSAEKRSKVKDSVAYWLHCLESSTRRYSGHDDFGFENIGAIDVILTSIYDHCMLSAQTRFGPSLLRSPPEGTLPTIETIRERSADMSTALYVYACLCDQPQAARVHWIRRLILDGGNIDAAIACVRRLRDVHWVSSGDPADLPPLLTDLHDEKPTSPSPPLSSTGDYFVRLLWLELRVFEDAVAMREAIESDW